MSGPNRTGRRGAPHLRRQAAAETDTDSAADRAADTPDDLGFLASMMPANNSGSATVSPAKSNTVYFVIIGAVFVIAGYLIVKGK